MNRLLLFLVLFCIVRLLDAQAYISDITRYGLEDGLTHNQIKWIYKDRRGMIWIGAANGISRYDGQMFKYVAKANFFKTYSQDIFEDKDGDLWLKTNDQGNQLFFFNTITEKIKSFEEKFKGKAPFEKEEYERGVCLANGISVIGTTKGKLIFADTTGQFEVKNIASGHKIEVFTNENAKGFWVCTFSNRDRKNTRQKGNKKNRLLLFDQERKLKFDVKQLPSITSVKGITPNNEIICQNRNDLFLINALGELDNKRLKALGEKCNLTHSQLTYDDQKNWMWQASQESIGVFDLDGQNLWINPPDYKELLVSSLFCYMVEGNNFWLGTINGLFKIQLQETPFQKAFYKKPKAYAQIDFQSCRGIISDENDDVYLASYQGCYNLNQKIQLLAPIKQGQTRKIPYLGLFIHKGALWTSSALNEVFRIDLLTGQKQVYSYSDIEGGYLAGWSFYQDPNDRLWMGTNHGLFYFDDKQHKILPFKAKSDSNNSSPNLIYAFYEDQENNVWLAATNGLFTLDVNKGTVEQYQLHKDQFNIHSSIEVRHIVQDKDGIFWLATQEGLIRLDKENKQQQLLTIDEGLSHNSIYAVYEDDYGFLWMSSDNGIMQLEKKTQKIKTYFPEDGITHREFNYISHHQAKDGTLYFGGLNGITYFHPRHFAKAFNQQPKVPLVLTECHLFSNKSGQQEDKMQDYLQTGQIILEPNDRYLSLQFALLDYSASERIQYVYSIDDEEGKLIKENALHISALPYGKHLLTIKGRTGNGLFSKQTLSVPLVVLKPFYWQWWFLSLCAISLFVSIFIFQEMKSRSYLKRQEALEQTVSERTQTIQIQAEELRLLDKSKSRFLANISHEFRTPLTLILNTLNQKEAKAKGRILLNKVEMNIMQRNAHRLQQLIDQLLDLSKLETGKMLLQISPENFTHYLRELITAFQSMAQQKQVHLSFHADIVDDLLYFDRDKMDKIIYNLLGNAIKFTPSGGLVKVYLSQNDKEMCLAIEDSGIGISEKDMIRIFDRFYQAQKTDEYHYEGTGLGLSLVKEFTEMHGGRVELHSQLMQGSCFKIYFPLGKMHFDLDVVHFLEPEFDQLNTEISNQQLAYHLLDEEEIPSLLIIEDNEDLLFQHRKQFTGNYNLLLAKDGKSGLSMAYKYIPDLIVCDIMMPGVNGYEVCRQLKLDERTNHIPIVLLTAKAAHKDKMEGLMIGADDYMIKPYDQQELSLRLQNLLELQRRLQKQWSSDADTSSQDASMPTLRNAFLDKCVTIIEDHLTHHDFGVEKMSKLIYMSRTQLFRKIKSITGTTPTHFIRTYRLKKARQLLLDEAGNASEISYMVGFSNPNYFFKCFKDEFGMTVGEFINKFSEDVRN